MVFDKILIAINEMFNYQIKKNDQSNLCTCIFTLQEHFLQANVHKDL